MVATGGMDGRVRVWRRARSGRHSKAKDGKAIEEDNWRDWEFLTSLETGSEIQVGPTAYEVEEIADAVW